MSNFPAGSPNGLPAVLLFRIRRELGYRPALFTTRRGLSMALFSGRDIACVRSERQVFDHLTFDLDAGEALVVTGANGSGKSSLLRLMSGLIEPAAGSLAWQGEAVSDDPASHRARLHYVGHLDAVKPALMPLETLAFWAELGGADRHTAAKALDAFGILDLADLPCRVLSAGQRKRLNLARLLARPAALWLLDEPTNGLDLDAIDRLRRAVVAHRATGGMVVIATHADVGLGDARRLDLGSRR
jgi:heme exporter protein A